MLVKISPSDIKSAQWGEWGEPGECSVTCGEGKRNRERECFDNQNNLVDDEECHAGPDGVSDAGQVECSNFDCRKYKFLICAHTYVDNDRTRLAFVSILS